MPVLSEVKQSLPSNWYYDPVQYARELEAIWCRDWVCVGREEAIPDAGNYLVASVGDQGIIVTRDEAGELRAFHNTCRHRGSILCRDTSGRFRSGRIVCPYHGWTYATDGRLLGTPRRIESDGFERSELGLYAVHVASWRGFIHVNLADEPTDSLLTQLGVETESVANWPLESLRTVHSETRSVACNWKLFWENYSECYHCPRIHPELCRIMPAYRSAVIEPGDLPDWTPRRDGDTGKGGVGPGLRSWTPDGQSALPSIGGLTEEDEAAGVVFASFTASMFVTAHPDYVRSVRIVPTGPETIDLVADWLLPEASAGATSEELAPILELARTVMRQDAEVCELNQRGLRCRRHEQGVLVAQEQYLWEFHEWLRGRLRDSGYGEAP